MKRSNTQKKDKKKDTKIRSSINLGKVFDKHVRSEFEDKDVEETMKTMGKDPYVLHVPVLTGGVGDDGVYNFYKLSVRCLKMPSLQTSPVPLERTKLLMN